MMRKSVMTFTKWLAIASVIAVGVAAPVMASMDISNDKSLKGLIMRVGSRLCLNGTSCTSYIVSDGTTVSVTGGISPSGDLTLAANKSLLGTAGTGAVDLSALTGTFKTPTGAHTINGAVTLAANKGIVYTAGTGAADFSLGTGVFKTSTGAATIGPGAITMSGDATWSANKGIAYTAGTGAADFSNGTGVFKTTTGAVTIGTGTVSITGSLGADLVALANLSGGFDMSVAAAASAAAGSTFDVVAGAGGTAATDSDGQAGGVFTATGGAGTAKNGAGVNDGSGGDVVLNGGARGGANGSAVSGIVRVGAPSVQSTKETRTLAVEGALEVDGTARFDGNVVIGGAGAGSCADMAGGTVTCHGITGTLNDTVDINSDVTAATVTWTNDKISSTSKIVISPCSAFDANAWISASVIPGAGTATVTLRNVGSGNQTAAFAHCFIILN